MNWGSNPDPGSFDPNSGGPSNPGQGGPGPTGHHGAFDNRTTADGGGETSAALPQPSYDPRGQVPPYNKKDLYDLMMFRMASKQGSISVSLIFGYDNIINNIAKAMLFGHIFDNQEQLSTAFRQMGTGVSPHWGKVSISPTSPILYSLSQSF